MQLGDSMATAPDQRSPADEILDKLTNNLAELLTAIDSGALDHLEAAEKIAMWQKFETFRNRLPLIDHRLIADAGDAELGPASPASPQTEQVCSPFLTWG
jgi:hypothetical protein